MLNIQTITLVQIKDTHRGQKLLVHNRYSYLLALKQNLHLPPTVRVCKFAITASISIRTSWLHGTRLFPKLLDM